MYVYYILRTTYYVLHNYNPHMACVRENYNYLGFAAFTDLFLFIIISIFNFVNWDTYKGDSLHENIIVHKSSYIHINHSWRFPLMLSWKLDSRCEGTPLVVVIIMSVLMLGFKHDFDTLMFPAGEWRSCGSEDVHRWSSVQVHQERDWCCTAAGQTREHCLPLWGGGRCERVLRIN